MFNILNKFKKQDLNKSFYSKQLNLDGFEFDIAIHPAKSRSVLIMYPGADGSIDGYNQKYVKIANLIQKKNIATVIRRDNKYYSNLLAYIDVMTVKLAHVIEHLYENIEEITNQKEIDLYLSGVSAGASAAAAILEELPQVKKVLFISPADSVGAENIARGLKEYQGEMYLVAGNQDEIRADKIAKFYYESGQKVKKKEIHIIPECDHQFKGKKNGKILSNAYLWALSDKKNNFPKSKGGIVLYE